MTSMHVQGMELLTAVDLEAIAAGDGPLPVWWPVFLFVVSESQSIIDGFRDGYNGG